MKQKYINYVRYAALCLGVICAANNYAIELSEIEESIALEHDDQLNFVPALEYDQRDAAIEGFDELLEHTEHVAIPAWKLTLQQWGTQLVTYIFYLKQQIEYGYHQAKIKIVGLFKQKNRIKNNKL